MDGWLAGWMDGWKYRCMLNAFGTPHCRNLGGTSETAALPNDGLTERTGSIWLHINRPSTKDKNEAKQAVSSLFELMLGSR